MGEGTFGLDVYCGLGDLRGIKVLIGFYNREILCQLFLLLSK